METKFEELESDCESALKFLSKNWLWGPSIGILTKSSKPILLVSVYLIRFNIFNLFCYNKRTGETQMKMNRIQFLRCAR